MKKAYTRQQSVMMLIMTAVLWSTGGLWIKVITWSPVAILGARCFVAMIVFWIYLRKPHIRLTKIELLGSICYVLTHITFVSATKLTTAANAIFLQYASPIYVVVLGYVFLKEKPQKADWIAMALIFSGMFLFFGDKLSLNGITGNIIAILSGMFFSVVMLVMRMQKDHNPGNLIFVGNILGFVVGLPFIFKESFTVSNISIILYLGIFQIGLAFVLYSVAVKHVRVLEANLILTLEPILNPIWVFFVIGEKPGTMAIVGSLLVIGAVTYRAIISARTLEFEVSPNI